MLSWLPKYFPSLISYHSAPDLNYISTPLCLSYSTFHRASVCCLLRPKFSSLLINSCSPTSQLKESFLQRACLGNWRGQISFNIYISKDGHIGNGNGFPPSPIGKLLLKLQLKCLLCYGVISDSSSTLCGSWLVISSISLTDGLVIYMLTILFVRLTCGSWGLRTLSYSSPVPSPYWLNKYWLTEWMIEGICRKKWRKFRRKQDGCCTMRLCICISVRKNGKDGSTNQWRNMPAKYIPLQAFSRVKQNGLSFIGYNCHMTSPDCKGSGEI